MTIRFYRRDAGAPLPARPALAVDCEFKAWRPAGDGPPQTGPNAVENWVWFAFDRVGVFPSHAFEELSVWRGGRMLHRLVVAPRWFRFPFMAPDDLQIGALWTAPDARRAGVAAAAMAEVHRRHAAPGRRFWCLVDDGNAASIRLAEASGYRLVGTGRRTRPLGISPLGRFLMDKTAGPSGG